MLSGWHVFALIIILLVFFGPSRLPSLGKSMGEAIRGFKKGLEGDEIDVTQNPPRPPQNLQAGQASDVTSAGPSTAATSQKAKTPTDV